MELCLVLLYWLNIFGSMSKYMVLPWTINCFHILVLVVRFHLSQTLDFSSFSVEYSAMPFFLTVPSYFCYNTLSLYQSKDIVGYAPLWRLFWMLLWQFPLSYPSMGQSSHIWRIDLIPWEDIYNPCSICWTVAFQPDLSTKFYRYRLQ